MNTGFPSYSDIAQGFTKWLGEKGYMIDEYTSEFTIQFLLACFLDTVLPPGHKCELEVSIRRFNIVESLRKKEIDLVVTIGNERHAIEIKFVRDRGTFNIGMFRISEDILFLEQLKDRGFNSVCSLAITNIPELYTLPNQQLNPRNAENLRLYTAFRIDRLLSGTLKILTGNLNEEVTLQREHRLEWFDFISKTKMAVVSE